MHRLLRSSLLRRGLAPLLLLTAVAVIAAGMPFAVFHGSLNHFMANSIAHATGASGPRDLQITSPATLTLSEPPYMPGTPFQVTYGEQVTLQKVVANTPADANNNSPLTPDTGQYFVGLQLTVKNTGSTAQGVSIPVVKTTDPNPACTAFGTDATMPGCTPLVQFPPAPLQPGLSITGCDVYSMPTRDQVTAVTYDYGGFADASANGQWTINAANGGTTPTSGTILLSLTLKQKPTTPFWKLDLLVALDKNKLTAITCPATVTIQGTGPHGTISTNANVCKNGAPQANVKVLFPVFLSAAHYLQPGYITPFTARLSVNNSTIIDKLNTTITTPPPPVWIGLGDSFSSGHHQVQTISVTNWPHCLNFDATNATGQCTLFSNDSTFSWVSRAATLLNQHYNVPAVWQIHPHILAHSGYSTTEMIGIELPAMLKALKSHTNSWNVVSLTGGANNIPWFSVMENFYLHNYPLHRVGPWDVTQPLPPADPHRYCPDSNQLYNSATTAPNRTIIPANLDALLTGARLADPNVRLVDTYYGYVDDENSFCYKSYLNRANGQIEHGSRELIDALDTYHASVDQKYKNSGNRIVIVDLRNGFTSLNGQLPGFGLMPMPYIQQTLPYGYPHPNDAGQTLMAQDAARGLWQADGK